MMITGDFTGSSRSKTITKHVPDFLSYSIRLCRRYSAESAVAQYSCSMLVNPYNATIKSYR